jgi:hypothetical protein
MMIMREKQKMAASSLFLLVVISQVAWLAASEEGMDCSALSNAACRESKSCSFNKQVCMHA